MIALALAGWAAAAEPVPPCGDDPELASLEAFHLLAVDPSPQSVAGLAVCLEDLGLQHLAQRHWIELARQGPGSTLFRHALDRTYALGVELGDLWSVGWLLDGLDEGQLPVGDGHDALLYVHGTQLIEAGEPEMAAEVLGDVGPAFPFQRSARLQLGRAEEATGHSARALAAYAEAREPSAAVAAAAPTSEAPAAPAAVADEARWRAALLLAGIDRRDEADALLRAVPPGSPWHDRALTDAARMWLEAQDTERAEPLVDALRGAVRGGAVVPELELLQARLEAVRCRPRRAARRLGRWERRERPLELVVAGIGHGKPDGALVYTQHLSDEAVDVGLPPGVVRRLERRPEVAWLRGHLAALEGEQGRLGALGDEMWRASVGEYLTDVLDDGRSVLRGMLGDLLLVELDAVGGELRSARREAEDLERLLAEGVPGCR